jgi:hypothetical protein
MSSPWEGSLTVKRAFLTGIVVSLAALISLSVAASSSAANVSPADSGGGTRFIGASFK